MSRVDLEGLFWQDHPAIAARGKRVAGEKVAREPTVRSMPRIPDTGWVIPKEFPNLDNVPIMAIDTETYDPFLLEEGPGWGRGKGHVVGLAVGVPGHQWYFPMRHTVGDNMNPDSVLAWAQHTFKGPSEKVFANAIYDIGWLLEEGVTVGGKIIDVQIAEPLLNENARSYALDVLGEKYLGQGKTDERLYDWLSLAYGGKPTRRGQGGNIFRAPAELVGPYAMGDVELPLRIWEEQKKELAAQDLMQLFELEMDLMPLLLAMRRRGVRVDLQRAEQLFEEFTEREKILSVDYNGISVYAPADLAVLARKRGLTPPKLESGNDSFAGTWLEMNMPDVHEVRKIVKARDTFIKGYILDMHVDGRLHCQFNQLRSDDSGTVSGRFSSSNPNLQNIPNRDPEMGPLIRGLYLPDEGEKWTRFDWSQIEFRLLTHYGRGDGAETAREMFRDDPTTDFHDMVAQLTGIDRKPAKNINFGLVYGMSEATMAEGLNRPLEDVKPLFAMYHERLPFVKQTYQYIADVAARRGYVKTLLGRRRRFDLWEPAKWGERKPALPHAEALAEYKKVRRAFTHKATNSVMQGSAADLMKLAMVLIWKSGVCDVLGAPLVTVHDELGWSNPGTPEAEEALAEVKNIMENCYKLKVPIMAEREEGESWGKVK